MERPVTLIKRASLLWSPSLRNWNFSMRPVRAAHVDMKRRALPPAMCHPSIENLVGSVAPPMNTPNPINHCQTHINQFYLIRFKGNYGFFFNYQGKQTPYYYKNMNKRRTLIRWQFGKSHNCLKSVEKKKISHESGLLRKPLWKRKISQWLWKPLWTSRFPWRFIEKGLFSCTLWIIFSI